MKKKLACLLLACLLLSGCSSRRTAEDHVSFYYPRAEYLHGTPDGVITAETQELSNEQTPEQLLALYLQGPQSEQLRSPLPQGVSLLEVRQEEQTLHLRLSKFPSAATDADFSLVCACLTLTCLDLWEVDCVAVTSDNRNLILTREDLTLFDDVTSLPTEESS